MFETELATETGPITIAIATAMDRNIDFAQSILNAIHKGITHKHTL